jgi:SAM-dependent methyltransferase
MSVTERPLIFDHKLLRLRRRRAALSEQPSFLTQRVAEDFTDRLAPVLRHFQLAVDLGTPGNGALKALAASGKAELIVAADALFSSGPSGKGASANQGVLALAADEEALPFRDGSLDLVVTALALHFVNDLPGVLVQVRRALKPDGLFIAALAGGDTLTELRQSFAAAEAEIESGVSPRVIPLLDVRAAGTLLQRAGFALPVVDLDHVTVRYDSPLALMHDLRALGATNSMIERSRRPLKRALLTRMMEIYSARFSDPDGRLRATFDIVWLSGWAPHPSQQKPLPPGTARQRLADALGAKEYSAGEKAGR